MTERLTLIGCMASQKGSRVASYRAHLASYQRSLKTSTPPGRTAACRLSSTRSASRQCSSTFIMMTVSYSARSSTSSPPAAM